MNKVSLCKKIISERCKLVKLCHINRCGPFFFQTQYPGISSMTTLFSILKAIRALQSFSLICKLEGHSVERIYLRQRSSDGSVNKTILKLRLALVAHRQCVYMGFSRRKIPHSSTARWQPRQGCRVLQHIRYQRKQSSSSIQTMIRIGLKS